MKPTLPALSIEGIAASRLGGRHDVLHLAGISFFFLSDLTES